MLKHDHGFLKGTDTNAQVQDMLTFPANFLKGRDTSY